MATYYYGFATQPRVSNSIIRYGPSNSGPWTTAAGIMSLTFTTTYSPLYWYEEANANYCFEDGTIITSPVSVTGSILKTSPGTLNTRAAVPVIATFEDKNGNKTYCHTLNFTDKNGATTQISKVNYQGPGASPEEINDWLENECQILTATSYSTLSQDTFTFTFTPPPENIRKGILSNKFCFRTCLLRHKPTCNMRSHGHAFGSDRKNSEYLMENTFNIQVRYNQGSGHTFNQANPNFVTMIAQNDYNGEITEQELINGSITRITSHFEMPVGSLSGYAATIPFRYGFGIGFVYLGNDKSQQKPANIKYRAVSTPRLRF